MLEVYSRKMESQTLLDFPLKLLHVIGINPHQRIPLNYPRIFICGISTLFILIELLFKCITEWEGLESMENLGLVLGLYQLPIKLVTMAVGYKRLGRIINNVNKFWPSDKYGDELKEEIEVLYVTGRKYTKAMCAVTLLCGLSYCIRPVFSKDRGLPIDSYHPVNRSLSPNYEIVYGVQLIMLPYIGISSLGFDILFISLIITAACQLKVLKKGFSKIPVHDENSLRMLHELIEHHNLILRCVHDMNKVFYVLLLNTFLSNMTSICIGLLCFIISRTQSLQVIFSFICYLSFYVFQIFFYCIAGTYLTAESEDVTQAVYDCDWWLKTHPQFRRACALVIQRANKTEKLTAGGIFDLNLINFTQVLKTAFSFFTVIRVMYKG